MENARKYMPDIFQVLPKSKNSLKNPKIIKNPIKTDKKSYNNRINSYKKCQKITTNNKK